MPLTLLAMAALATSCAPDLSPTTLTAIAKVESGLDPWAIGVNDAPHRILHPESKVDAIALAGRLISSGANIDLGLGPINVRNLERLHLTLADAFEPCANLRASAAILREGYGAAPTSDEPLAVLRTLSIYNTGRSDRGLENGYVAKVLAAASSPPDPRAPTAAVTASVAPGLDPPPWSVFGARTDANTVLVFSSLKPGADQ